MNSNKETEKNTERDLLESSNNKKVRTEESISSSENVSLTSTVTFHQENNTQQTVSSSANNNGILGLTENTTAPLNNSTPYPLINLEEEAADATIKLGLSASVHNPNMDMDDSLIQQNK